MTNVSQPWSLDAPAVAGALETDIERGLSPDEAAARLERFGANQLRAAPRRSRLKAFAAQFADWMIALLAAAALVSVVVGDWQDSLLIAAIVLGNAAIGYVQEQRAEQALEALKKLSQPRARAWRGGHLSDVPAEQLVPGDVIELATGARMPADGRILEAVDLEVDESPLTGESMAVEKSPQPVAAGAPLPDRTSMVYAGTTIARGRAKAVVTGTGMATELGKIAELLESAEAAQTPLQRRLASLSKRLAVVVVIVCLVVFVAGVAEHGFDRLDRRFLSQMLLTSVSLAVAAIPEGLPAVITIALALGSQRMVRRKAIIRQLSAVETLGSVDVICSDKTGTLTQNRMAVSDVVPDPPHARLMHAAVLCNDAKISPDGELIGTATETAILQAARDRGADVAELRTDCPRLAEFPFTSARKRMTTLHRVPEGGRVAYVKGAAEMILDRSTARLVGEATVELSEADRAELLAAAESLAAQGRRVLGLAYRLLDDDALSTADEIERDFTFLGFLGIVDPVRPEAREAIARCRTAGIRAVMITGDHRVTAAAVARELSLIGDGEDPGDNPGDGAVLTGGEIDQLDDDAFARQTRAIDVYARVAPAHKLRLVRAYQAGGSVVAMTGDGVNDAPALKQADIGVAMGITGTDVSKEAANMVLSDDNFASIIAAVEEGRIVYDNIRRFVRYLLTANTGEIFVLLFAILLGMEALPLLPVHLLWINLVTDGLPALALGYERAERGTMRRPPRRRDESIFAGGMTNEIVSIGLLMAVACLMLFHYFLDDATRLPGGANRTTYARTVVFYTLSMFQLFYVMALRSTEDSVFSLGLFTNYRLAGAVVMGAVLQLSVVYVPQLRPMFHTVGLTLEHLALATGVSTLAFFAVEGFKLARRLDRRSRGATA